MCKEIRYSFDGNRSDGYKVIANAVDPSILKTPNGEELAIIDENAGRENGTSPSGRNGHKYDANLRRQIPRWEY